MKHLLFFFVLAISTSSFSQKTHYNIQKGAVASGYDVVAYFNNKTAKGNKKLRVTFDNVIFLFSSKKNLETFQESPKKFIPQYGGYCAYAIGKTGEKVSINPKTFEIRNEKLYLFYNSWGTNTLELWKKEDAQKLQQQADVNWEKMLQ